MKYPLLIPSVEVKDFREMKKKEAEFHFKWFMDQIPTQLEVLIRHSKLNLDYSQTSLITIWTWYLNQVEIVDKSVQELEDEYLRKSGWLQEFISPQKVSVESQAIAFDIAIYLGEVMRRHHGSIEWGVVYKPKSFASVNRPLLIGFSEKIEMDVVLIVANKMRSIIKGERNTDTLFKIYQIWKEYV
ncbi:hypothetical protein [Paenibacillus sp. NRS-1760]|uniref:hypothetical protein n=1 Tax=Paenibacillus sp. NRS-1760 TaxID=3233902 RepID=UPI003D28A22A